MKKSDKIRAILKANPNMSVAEIAKQAGTNIQYVYTVKYMDKKRKRAANKIKVADKPKEEKSSAHLYTRIHNLTKEIDELTVIIAYLEHRVKVAEAKHGATV